MSQNQHLRELKSHVFLEHDLTDEFIDFVVEEVVPIVKLIGYKLDEKRRVLIHVTHNLILCELAGGVAADSRDVTKGDRLRIGVWDAVVAAGLARKCIGSEQSGLVTRYRATGDLLTLRDEWNLAMLTGIGLVKDEPKASPTNRELVYLHTGKQDIFGEPLPTEWQKQPVDLAEHIAECAQVGEDGLPSPMAIKNGLSHWRSIESVLDNINRENLKHGWAATRTHDDGTSSVWQPNICIRQIHNGRMFNGARLYTWGELSGQNLPKKDRQRMLIDGQPTAELDFGGMHTRMLYHQARRNPSGDIYVPDLVLPKWHATSATDAEQRSVRKFIKRATNIFWNVTSRPAAHSAIGKALSESPDRSHLITAIKDVECLDGVSGLVGRIMDAHPDLLDRFFTGCGMELMTIDGQIMLRIMSDLTGDGIPALPIHDSIVCRISDVDTVQQTMIDTYEMFMSFEPVVSRVY